eukprot:11660072-Heterocapsa_arctica.AAC.1
MAGPLKCRMDCASVRVDAHSPLQDVDEQMNHRHAFTSTCTYVAPRVQTTAQVDELPARPRSAWQCTPHKDVLAVGNQFLDLGNQEVGVLR